MKANDEKTNRFKSEKMINVLSDQNNMATKDLNMKINILQETIEKDGNYQNQQRERDIEIYKNIIGKLTEKISDIVKKEIEERFKADLNNRENNLQIKSYFENELGFLKRDFEKFVGQNQAELQKISLECSERTHNVSKYIDQQIQESLYGRGNGKDLLKNFVEKLTDQVKFNVVSQNNKNAYFDEKIGKIEQAMQDMCTSLEGKINSTEDRLIERMNTLKIYTEMNLQKMNKDFFIQIRDVSRNFEKNVKFLSTQLIDTRKRTSDNFEVIMQDNREKFKAVIEDMKTVCNRVVQYENLLKNYDERYQNTEKKLHEDIHNFLSKLEVHVVNERLLHEVQINLVEDQIKQTNEKIVQKEKELKEIIDKNKKETDESIDNIYKQMKVINDDMTKFKEETSKNFDSVDHNMQEIILKNVLEETMTKAEFAHIADGINNLNDRATNIEGNVQALSTNMEEMNKDLGEQMDLMVGVQANLKDLENNIKTNFAKTTEITARFNDFESLTTNEIIIETGILNAETVALRKIIETNEQLTNDRLAALEEDLSLNKDGNSSLANSLRSTLSEMERNSVLEAAMNKAEFDKIYKILNQLGSVDYSQFTKVEKVEPGLKEEAVDNKIKSVLENLKKENNDMWTKFSHLEQKYYQPTEKKKIIGEVPPVVLPKNETIQNVLELAYEDYNFPVPFDCELVAKLITMNKLDRAGRLQNSNALLLDDQNQGDNVQVVQDEKMSKKSQGTAKANNPQSPNSPQGNKTNTQAKPNTQAKNQAVKPITPKKPK